MLNLHSLRGNHVGLAHMIQESWSLIYVFMHSGKQMLNLIVSEVGATNEQIANVTQKPDNRIFQLETLLPMYLH